MKRLSLLSVVLLIGYTAFCQSFYAIRRERNLIGSVGYGTSTYFGELSNSGDYIDAKPTLHTGIQYYLTNRISARVEANWFYLAGSDSKANDGSRQRRNLSFTSNNFELGLSGLVSLFPIGDRYYRRPFFNVYGFAGVAGLYFNPKAEYLGQKYALQPLQTEGVKYSRLTLVIPYGLGIRLKVSPLVNLAFEGGWRKTFTDYLDDVSTVHKDVSTFSDPIAAALADRRPEVGRPVVVPGTQRGNSKTKDSYMLVTAKIEYYLPFEVNKRSSGYVYSKKRRSTYRYNRKGGIKRKRR